MLMEPEETAELLYVATIEGIVLTHGDLRTLIIFCSVIGITLFLKEAEEKSCS
jgi:hypothetical protein